MATLVLPSPKDVRDLVEGLLGRDVTVSPGRPVVPTADVRAGVGVYVDDNLTLAAAAAADLPFCAFAGSALGLIPVAHAEGASEEGLTPAMWENFAEILNVGAALLNRDGAAHLRLYSTTSPAELPANDVGELLRGFGNRIDLTIDIAGYGSGSLSIVRKPF
ncbi:hypothetical protein [Sporichthya polymorpha]|uniref:hypothetical protein n=1 Tax=Sporichthya polymorpha TaxID=35751 RepID=UPI000371F1A8|nr:hypothetical protein [Sporichthya polymorpha]